jgi:hypothetical protein
MQMKEAVLSQRSKYWPDGVDMSWHDPDGRRRTLACTTGACVYFYRFDIYSWSCFLSGEIMGERNDDSRGKLMSALQPVRPAECL